MNSARKRLLHAIRTHRVRQRRKSRQIAKRKIHLRHVTRSADVPDAKRERRIKLRGIDQVEKCPLRIDARNNRIGGDLFAVGEHHRRDSAVLDVNVLDFSVRADFSASLARSVSKSAGERAKPSARKCRRAHRMRISSGPQKKYRGAPCRPWAERRPKNAACGDRRAKHLGFEKLGHKIRSRHWSPAQQIEETVLAKATDVAPRFEEIPEILRRRRIDGRRSNGRNLREDLCDFLERRGEFCIALRIFSGKASDPTGGLGMIVVKKQRPPVGSWCANARVRIQHLEPVLVEPHLTRDVRAKRPSGVRERRSVKSRMKFLGNRSAADDFAALQHQRLESAFRQVERADKRIMTAADNDHALSDRHSQFFSLSGVTTDGATPAAIATSRVASITGSGATVGSGGAIGLAADTAADLVAGLLLSDRDAATAFFHSFKITWLAILPGAPMIPPPGCVADPHMYKLSTGVR